MSTPAFPVPNSPHYGLTKREYMALHLLAALASHETKYLPSVPDAVALTDRLIAELDKVQS